MSKKTTKQKKEVATNNKGEESILGNVPTERVKNSGKIAIISELGKKYQLNDKQIRFCDLYINSSQFRGNGVRSYAEAYNINLAKPGCYNSAKAAAHVLLSNDNILQYMNHISELDNMNDAFIDSQLSLAVAQVSDWNAKVSALRLALELKGRLEKKQNTTAIQFNINLDSDKATVSVDDKAA